MTSDTKDELSKGFAVVLIGIGMLCLGLGMGGCIDTEQPCNWLQPGEYRIEGVRTSGPDDLCAPSVDFVAELDNHGLQPVTLTQCVTKEQTDLSCNVTATTDCPNGFYLVYMLAIRNPGTSGGRIQVGYRGDADSCYYAVTYTYMPASDAGTTD